jgi:predicted acyltransferase
MSTGAISETRIRVSEAMQAASGPVNQRLMSLDALRGFDMFWIVGMEEVFGALSRMFPMTPTIHDRVDHAPWAGFHFYDIIFPLFAFIIGVSLVFSLGKSIAVEGKGAASWKVIKRSAILFLLGVFMYRGIADGYEKIRILGVLQRLAICSCGAGLAFIWLKPRGILALTIGLLAGYWAMMTFIPVPGFGAGDYAEGHNLANWIDKTYLPWRKWDGDHDPEGLLSSLPAICNSLLGIFAGLLLKNASVDANRKVKLLMMWGVAGIAAGLLWHLQFPIIKKIWTSSFVLFTCGISSIALGLFYWIIDVKQIRAWAKPFIWIGMNAITIYVVAHLVSMAGLARRFVGGEIAIWFNGIHVGLGDFIPAVGGLIFSILFCRFLYKRKIFLRV